MSVLDDLLKQHRRRIIAREEAAFRELLSVYRELQRDLDRQYKEIQKLMADSAASGEEISRSWVARSRRLAELIDQVKSQIVRFGGQVTGVVSREQLAAISISGEQTADAVKAIVGSRQLAVGSLLPTRAIENAVGMMGDGSPMIAYFEKTFAPAVAAALRSELARAVAMGTDFNTIARRLMAAGDITRWRALPMARTEVNRVRRATTLETYRENSDVFTGWEWVANKSPRTCPVCLALDGRIFELKDEFPQHVNCRCTLIPVIAGVTRPKRELGAEWFARQTDEVKEKIIGVEALEAYARGDIELKDFVGWRNSKEFGRSVYTKKLADVLMNKGL
ncbi:MAG: phage minor head protein [Candidatus Moraniibacteriota bacterium]